MFRPEAILAYCTLAMMQGVLVVLPRPAGSAVWRRVRSPGWALALPGALMVGTFGVLAVPSTATGLAALAALGTPVLVCLAVLGVVRGSRRAWLAALVVVGAGAATLHSWPAALAMSVLTALGCLTLGAALVRATPLPWLACGIAAMCIVDVVLLATGVGQPAAAQMDTALSHTALPAFDQARLGTISVDYPDLVLVGVLGATLAGSARQLTAGVLVAVLVAANGLLFLLADMLPGTVPVGIAAAVIAGLELRERRSRLPSTLARRPSPLRRPTPQPGVARPAEA
jgi:hypothetical protein